MAKLTTEKYFNIDPDVLVTGRTLTFDVFIYLPINGRVIMFRPNGDLIEDLDAVARLRAKGLKHFYVREAEREAFETYASASAPKAPDAAIKGSELSADDLAADPLARAAREKAVQSEARESAASAETQAPDKQPPAPRDFTPKPPAEDIMAGLLGGPSSALEAQSLAKLMIKKILKSTGAGAMADIVDNPDTEHATSVAIYATLFAMGLKNTDGQLLQDVIIASLMHDIGLTQIDPSFLATPRNNLQPSDRVTYEKHVMLGLELLPELDYKPNSRVLTLIGQHHEKFNGTGFPNHLESFRVDEYAQLISLADLLDSLCRGRRDGIERSLGDALLVVAQYERTTTFPEYFNPNTFSKVMSWLKTGGGIDYLAAAETAVGETKKKMLKAG